MMRWKNRCAAVLCGILLFTLTGCADTETPVYVQSVAELSGMGGIGIQDRFAGLVVSENVAEITRDDDKTISQLLVKEGDDVTQGQELFLYDTQQLELDLDRKNLELEQLKATIANYKTQIAELEAQRAKANSGDQLAYTIQIQTLQLDLKEAELNQKAKETEVAQAAAILENAAVVSPVTGRVQSISENGFDNYGNPLPYITIQQTGSYRVKGIIGELQQGSIMEGTRMKILSRTDETALWYGTVTLVDYESPSQGSEYDMYYGMAADEMTSSSKYPFYVELEDTTGLLLGQHVYMEADTGEQTPTGIAIGSYFVCYEEDGSAYVWAENRGRLEKRPVTLGEYNDITDTYSILSGLTQQDHIAYPDPELCKEGVPVTHSNTVEGGGA